MTKHPRLHQTPAGLITTEALSDSTDLRPVTGRVAVLGLALFAVSLGSFAPETRPDPGTATAPQVREFAAANAGTLQLNAVAALASLSLLVALVAALAQQVAMRRPGSAGPGAMLALVAVVAALTLVQTATASVFARADQLSTVSDEAVVSFYHLLALGEWLYTLTVLVPCAALVATYSWLALQTRLIARWVPVAGLAVTAVSVITALLLIVPVGQVDLLVLPLFGWWLWPLAVGGASAARWWRTRS